jgi:hypothetical protein
MKITAVQEQSPCNTLYVYRSFGGILPPSSRYKYYLATLSIIKIIPLTKYNSGTSQKNDVFEK